MKGEILFLAHRLPFPPDRGDKIRAHHVLGALAKLARVHVGCFAESATDRVHESDLAHLAASHCLVDRTKPLPYAGIEAVAKALPISLTAFQHPQMTAFVEQTLREHPIEAIYIFSGQMGQYVPPTWDGRLVVDLVDVDSAKFEQYASDGRGLMAGVHAREARMMRDYEAYLARIADRTLLISEAEAELLRSRLPPNSSAQIEVLGNGIDASSFDPARWPPQEELQSAPGPQLVFTGQMDYPPNIDAVRRMARAILPAIRHQHPQARFHVVGRAPTGEVRMLDGQGGVRVWGEVPAVQPFLAAADIVVVPLALGRGVQNKVLEAMAMACPVLLTSQAATGIGAEDAVHWAIADGDNAFAGRALALLADRARALSIGQSARKFAVEKMSWPAALVRLPEILGGVSAGKAHRDAA